ncbi:hypothetical protein HPB49_026262 [Dermacentor silvarum]|nr:hypothetical protein HPB49_026262 [Dermacentor silvarum]
MGLHCLPQIEQRVARQLQNKAGWAAIDEAAHIRDAHSGESNFRVVCGIEGCPKTYTVVDSLKKHAYREHRSVIGGSSSTVPHGRTFCEAESGEQPTSDGDVDDPAPASTVTDDATSHQMLRTDADASRVDTLQNSDSSTNPTTNVRAPSSEFFANMQKKVCLFFDKMSEEHKVLLLLAGVPELTIMENGPPADEQSSAAPKRGPRFKNQNEPRKKYNRVSEVGRAKIVDASRSGGNLKQLARMFGINVKTARSITVIDPEVSLKTEGSVRKFGAYVVTVVTKTVDYIITFTLKEIKRTVEQEMPGLTSAQFH